VLSLKEMGIEWVSDEETDDKLSDARSEEPEPLPKRSTRTRKRKRPELEGGSDDEYYYDGILQAEYDVLN